MQNFAEDFKVAVILGQQTVTSVAATDVINMSEYDKVTFIITTGTVGTGTGLSFRQMDAVGDSVATESRVAIDYYWEADWGAGSDTYTKNSADTLSSYGGITIANGDDSAIFITEIRGSQLTDGNNCVACYVDSSAASLAIQIEAICHPRYKSQSPPSALA